MATKTVKGSDATLHAQGENGEMVLLGELQGEVTITTETEDKPRGVNNLEDAARIAYGVSETRKEIEKINNVADREISKWQGKIGEVEDWRAEVLRPLADKLDYFTMLLTLFHMQEFDNAPNEKAQAKLKSIKLPYGVTLASKEQATKLEVTDDAALLAYAKENGNVKVTEKAEWAEIKKTLKINDENGLVYDANGEEVPFVVAVPQDRKFEVK